MSSPNGRPLSREAFPPLVTTGGTVPTVLSMPPAGSGWLPSVVAADDDHGSRATRPQIPPTQESEVPSAPATGNGVHAHVRHLVMTTGSPRRWAVRAISIPVVATLSLATLAACSTAQQTPPAATAVVSRATISTGVSATGSLAAITTQDL